MALLRSISFCLHRLNINPKLRLSTTAFNRNVNQIENDGNKENQPKTTPSEEQFKNPYKRPEEMKRNDDLKVTRKSYWFPVMIGTFIFGAMTYFVKQMRDEAMRKVELKKARSLGKPLIGGSFELVNGKGESVKSEDFLGKWVLIYFGFTHCPDVCPEELEKISNIVERLAQEKLDIVPLFISVDPERDTPELVEKYLAEFSPRFIGLTGSKEQIEKATRAYRIYYSVGPKDQDNDYIVDHTIISYLVNPKGRLEDYFGQSRVEDEMFLTIRSKIRNH